jgi:hypothetical protein
MTDVRRNRSAAPFLELLKIGQQQLQCYCNEWLQRPIAREYALATFRHNMLPGRRFKVNAHPFACCPDALHQCASLNGIFTRVRYNHFLRKHGFKRMRSRAR